LNYYPDNYQLFLASTTGRLRDIATTGGICIVIPKKNSKILIGRAGVNITVRAIPITIDRKISFRMLYWAALEH